MFSWRSIAIAGTTALAILPLSTAIQVSAGLFATTNFDFVIVGGGSAGLAVATRLSDNPKIKVGVIEAGLLRLDDNILIPGLFGAVLGDPDYDWNFTTVPQSRLGGRQVSVFRGKMLGGTSGLNGLVHSRASKAEYDGLETLGNAGWNFKNLQDGMKKSENWTAPSKFLQEKYFANNDPADHGTRGAIRDSVYSFYTDIVSPFFKAAQNLKIAINKAMSSGVSAGVWTLNASIDPKNISRAFSYNGYYVPNAHRTNLVIVAGARVAKIVTKNVNGLVTATGVEYSSGNVTYTVKVQKEVILSAGTIQTPQVLELSGIGNKTLLNSLSIPVVLDLPGVGENHQDHFGVTATFQAPDNFTNYGRLTSKLPSDQDFAAEQLQLYNTNRTGLYSATSATTLAFLPLNDIMAPAVSASLLSDLDAALPNQPQHLKEQFALQRKWLNDPTVPQIEFVLFATLGRGTPEAGNTYYTISVFLQHLWSRGSIHISSNDPFAAPSIDGNYLNSPGDFDMKLLIEAVKWTRKIAQTEPLKSATLSVISPSVNATDEEIRDIITSEAASEWHFAGTAAMLPRDQNGVVDPQLKVYGTSNIRVIDASILPVHIATHPTLTLYGIAERAAEALRTGIWQ